MLHRDDKDWCVGGRGGRRRWHLARQLPLLLDDSLRDLNNLCRRDYHPLLQAKGVRLLAIHSKLLPLRNVELLIGAVIER